MNDHRGRRLAQGLALVSITTMLAIGACSNDDSDNPSNNPSNPPTPNDATPPSDTSAPRDTVPVEPARATALILGRTDVTITADVRITVNTTVRNVSIAPDRTFVIRDVPSGNVTLLCESDGLRGQIVIDAVAQGEVIEVSVQRRVDVLVVIVVRREVLSEPAREVVTPTGAPLEIRGNNVCFFLRAGTFNRDVSILGDNVKLVGAPHTSCEGGRSIITGTLVVKGNNATIFDVDLAGRVIISGNNARIEDPCTGFFSHGTTCLNKGCEACVSPNQSSCQPGAGSGGSTGGTGGSKGTGSSGGSPGGAGGSGGTGSGHGSPGPSEDAGTIFDAGIDGGADAEAIVDAESPDTSTSDASDEHSK